MLATCGVGRVTSDGLLAGPLPGLFGNRSWVSSLDVVHVVQQGADLRTIVGQGATGMLPLLHGLYAPDVASACAGALAFHFVMDSGAQLAAGWFTLHGTKHTALFHATSTVHAQIVAPQLNQTLSHLYGDCTSATSWCAPLGMRAHVVHANRGSRPIPHLRCCRSEVQNGCPVLCPPGQPACFVCGNNAHCCQGGAHRRPPSRASHADVCAHARGDSLGPPQSPLMCCGRLCCWLAAWHSWRW